MPIPPIDALVDALRTAGLLGGTQLTDLARAHHARLADPGEFGETLVRLGWLTPWQISEVLAGRAADLVLGQYVLLERLGEGGMGVVFKARHRSLGRVVAIKLLRKDRLRDPEAAARFRREIELAAQLAHPNIVLAYDADRVGDIHFFAMEYIDGIDLARLARKSGPLAIPSACEYVRQAALGLQHAHERGLVHRDIKPSNLILQRPRGQREVGPVIKLLDLGLARLQQQADLDEESGFLTRDGGLVGTVDFMAPEQADNAQQVDIRADLYSLGCTFYYLLTRQVLFPGGSVAEKVFKHRYEPPPPLLHARPEVPPAVVSVVYRLLAKRPENRFATPAALAEALAALVPASIPVAYPIDVHVPEVPPFAIAHPVGPTPVVPPFGHCLPTPPNGESERSADRPTATPTAFPPARAMPVNVPSTVAFNHAGTRVVSARFDGGIRLWDLTGPEPREAAVLLGHRERVVTLGFAADDASFVSGGLDGRAIWWDAEDRRQLREWQFPHPIAQVALAPDGQHVAILGDNGATYVLRLVRPEGPTA